VTADRAPRASDPIISRYSELARAALAGQAIADCEPGAFADVCFGAAAYADAPDDLQTPQAFRVLRPGGRLAISDVTADQGTDPGQRADAEQQAGCLAGTLTQHEYRELLAAAGVHRHLHYQHP
jgi:hypothetical protein